MNYAIETIFENRAKKEKQAKAYLNKIMPALIALNNEGVTYNATGEICKKDRVKLDAIVNYKDYQAAGLHYLKCDFKSSCPGVEYSFYYQVSEFSGEYYKSFVLFSEYDKPLMAITADELLKMYHKTVKLKEQISELQRTYNLNKLILNVYI